MAKQTYKSVKNELFRSNILFSIAIILALGGTFSFILYRAQVSSIHEFIKQRNQSINYFVEGFFTESLHTVNLLSDNQLLKKEGTYNEEKKSELLNIFQSFTKVNPNITYLYSGYEDKSLYINDYTPPLGFDPTERPWYKNALNSIPNASVCEPYQDINSQIWLMATSKAIINDSGKVLGVVALDSEFDILQSLLAKRHSKYQSSYSYVLKENGETIIHQNFDRIKQNIFDYIKVLSPVTFSEPEGYFTYKYDGHKKLAYYSKINKNGWIVATVINTEEIFHPIIKKVSLFLTGILLISVMWGRLQSASLSRKFVQPLMQLKTQMESIVRGTREKYTDWQYPNNEIGQIAKNAAQLAQDELLAKNVELEEKKIDLEYLSNTDQLTKLPNRRKLELELQIGFENSKRHKYALSLLIIDIDLFKKVNDEYGHQTGDLVLTELAALLENHVRITDTAGRWGGEEFLVVSPSTDSMGAKAIAENLCEIIRNYPFSVEKKITVSIGVAQLQEEQSLDDLLLVADKNLYQAKERGRDRVVVSV